MWNHEVAHCSPPARNMQLRSPRDVVQCRQNRISPATTPLHNRTRRAKHGHVIHVMYVGMT
jgi:hypothetical protein